MYFIVVETGWPDDPFNVELRDDGDKAIAASDNPFKAKADALAWIKLVQAGAAKAPFVPPWPKAQPAAHWFVGLVWPSGFGWNFGTLDKKMQDTNLLDGQQPFPSREAAKAAIEAYRAAIPTAPIK